RHPASFPPPASARLRSVSGECAALLGPSFCADVVQIHNRGVTPDLSTPISGTPGNDSANNATRLLTALHRRGGTATRAELTADLDSGRSAISYALADLVERGLVTVDERQQQTATGAMAGTGGGRGRPSHLVSVAPTSPKTAIPPGQRRADLPDRDRRPPARGHP